MSAETNNVQNKSVAVIGAGLVGSLAALTLSKLGYSIDLYEYREDMRMSELAIGRSINLALSVRGRKALAEIGLENKILENAIPLKGRMLHSCKGEINISPYDINTNQCIYSIGRKHLNEVLLSTAELQPNIRLHFNQKLVSFKLNSGELNFYNSNTKQTSQSQADIIIGCDGAFSKVRSQILKNPGFNYSQTYIEHGYIELCIPAKNGGFAMPVNYLHIWPRGQFMMIALPNQDYTWTVTLFMPFVNFHKITSEKELLLFFEEHFSDSIPLIGQKRLIHDFFKTKPQHLVSVKCHPYHIASKVLLLGDAAHAMVPFYGQGMNAGFEDVSLLNQILRKNVNDFESAIKEFTEIRWKDAHAICDLAMDNYIEMRDLVTRRTFIIRKTIDEYLFSLMPSIWIPLYNSVSFSTMPYEQCRENRKWQNKLLKQILAVGLVTFSGVVVAFISM